MWPSRDSQCRRGWGVSPGNRAARRVPGPVVPTPEQEAHPAPGGGGATWPGGGGQEQRPPPRGHVTAAESKADRDHAKEPGGQRTEQHATGEKRSFTQNAMHLRQTQRLTFNRSAQWEAARPPYNVTPV